MVRYRQTLVGAAWALLQPLLLMVVFTVFFGLLARLPSSDLPYPVFFFLGLVPWHMVAKSLTEGSTSVVNNAAMVTRVYFPRAYFPSAVALSALLDLMFMMAAAAVLLLIFNIIPGLNVIWVPFFIGVAWISGLGVSLWLSALNVAYRDIAQLLPFLAQLWMFASPIIYPSTLVPDDFQPLYFLNPMALVVDGIRWAVAGTQAPPALAWMLGTAVAATLLISGFVFFRKRESAFADIV